MILRRGYVYRLELNAAQRSLCARTAGCTRAVSNHLLAEQFKRLARGEWVQRYETMSARLTELKRSPYMAFLNEVPAQALQQSLRDLDRAFQDAFDPEQPGKRMPVFKKKGKARDSFRLPQGFRFDAARRHRQIFLPKLGWVRFRKRRPWEGTVKNVTVYREGRHWFMSLQTERTVEVPEPLPGIVAGDLGVIDFLALSDGRRIPSLNAFKRHAERLAILQRRLARKVRFSSNWKKLNRAIARLHQRIANLRRDFIHKLAHGLAKTHGTVILEDLRVKAMTASAAGSVENPGQRVARKSGLNRSILDQGWGLFATVLGYKLAERGGQLILVDARNSSRECPKCHHVGPENRPTRERFCCVACGWEKNADLNAALNLLERGLLLLGWSPERIDQWMRDALTPGHGECA